MHGHDQYVYRDCIDGRFANLAFNGKIYLTCHRGNSLGIDNAPCHFYLAEIDYNNTVKYIDIEKYCITDNVDNQLTTVNETLFIKSKDKIVMFVDGKFIEVFNALERNVY